MSAEPTRARQITTSLQQRQTAAATGSATPPQHTALAEGDNPISSLRHIRAFAPEAEAAVDRAEQAAQAAAARKALRSLPPPWHLQGGRSPTATHTADVGSVSPSVQRQQTSNPVATAKQLQLGPAPREKENLGVRVTAKSKENPFASFSCR